MYYSHERANLRKKIQLFGILVYSFRLIKQNAIHSHFIRSRFSMPQNKRYIQEELMSSLFLNVFIVNIKIDVPLPKLLQRKHQQSRSWNQPIDCNNPMKRSCLETLTNLD